MVGWLSGHFVAHKMAHVIFDIDDARFWTYWQG